MNHHLSLLPDASQKSTQCVVTKKCAEYTFHQSYALWPWSGDHFHRSIARLKVASASWGTGKCLKNENKEYLLNKQNLVE